MRGEEGSREAEKRNKWPDRQAVVDVLSPIISTFLSKRRIIEKIDSLEETEGAGIDFQFHPSFAYLRDIDDDNVLENKYVAALEHKKQLEDKAKSLVALTTISATMMLGLGSTASSMFGGIVQLPARVILAAVMIFSAFYMVAAAINSISASHPSTKHTLLMTLPARREMTSGWPSCRTDTKTSSATIIRACRSTV